MNATSADTVSNGLGNRVSSMSGIWVSHDYECPWGTRNTEQVQVTQVGSTITAVKITGDRCVPAGNVTFEGELVGNAAHISWMVGTLENPASGRSPGTLTVIDDDHFEARVLGSGQMRFYRMAPLF